MKKNLPLKLLNILLILCIYTVAMAQETGEVSGTVTSANGEAIPGVSILVKNTSKGTITDLNGVYHLENVNLQTDVLIFTFIGMETKEVEVSGQTKLDVVLQESATELGEVVAIGYGTVKKRDITGSVSSVQGDDLKSIPSSTAAEALTGKMAGVQVLTTEGSPDADIRIRVRGGGSITQDNSPLYIVDGFPVASISDIPSSEIQSIDVLKDASSTAIYGARGANGVIIITTKSGKEGKVSVSYNAYLGFSEVADRLTTLGVEDYVKYQYEWAVLGDNLPNYEKFFGQFQDIDLYNGQPPIDWYDQVFGRTGKVFNQDLTISGGTDKTRFSFGYAGRDSKEIMLGSDYKRNNISLKLDNKPNDKVKLSFSTRYSDTKINGGGAIEQTGATPTDSRVKQSMLFIPMPFNTFGDFTDDELSGSMVNPLDAVADNDRKQSRKRFNIGASFSWKIIDNLEFKTEEGLDYYTRTDDRFRGLTTYYVKNTPPSEFQNMPAVQSYGYNSTSIRSTNTLNYDFKNVLGANDHSLKLLVGQELVTTKSNSIYNEVFGFPTFYDSELAFNLIASGNSNDYSNATNPDDKLLSFFGRVNYDFKGRYLFSATFRADGSSRFSKGNQWGYFPSAAAAWRISDESFMDGLSSFLSDLKLRVSYGTAGNNNIPADQTAQVFRSQTTAYLNNVSTYFAPAPDPSTSRLVMANPDLKWETTYTRNLGLDFGFFNNRLNGTAELYLNTTKDLLIFFPVGGSGYDYQYRNMGETENKGFELSLNWTAIDKKDFGLNIGFNIGFNNNNINSLGIMEDFGQDVGWASTEINGDYWIAVGGAVGKMRGYNSDGRYEVADFEPYNEVDGWVLRNEVADNSGLIGTLRPGMMKLKDTNGDGIVDIDDVTIIGDANPDHTGGLNINARAYGFDLSAVFSWSYGNDIYNANKIEYTTGRYQFRNMIDIMADGQRWTNIDADGQLVDDPATLTAMNANTTMWSPYMGRHIFSDWAVEDGAFLRLNTLSLGYTLPQSISDKLRIQRLRFYVSGYNLFVLTNYSGFDPEVSSRRNTQLTPGVDYSAYPKSRQVLFGLNLNF